MNTYILSYLKFFERFKNCSLVSICLQSKIVICKQSVISMAVNAAMFYDKSCSKSSRALGSAS